MDWFLYYPNKVLLKLFSSIRIGSSCGLRKIKLLGQANQVSPEQFAVLVKQTVVAIHHDNNLNLATMLESADQVLTQSARQCMAGNMAESTALLDFARTTMCFAHTVVDYGTHIGRGLAKGAINGLNVVKTVENLGNAAVIIAQATWQCGSNIVRANMLSDRILYNKLGLTNDPSLQADVTAFEQDIAAQKKQIAAVIDTLANKWNKMSGPERAECIAEFLAEGYVSGKALAQVAKFAGIASQVIDTTAARFIEDMQAAARPKSAFALEGAPNIAGEGRLLAEAASDIEPLVKEAHLAANAAKTQGATEARIGSEIVNDVKVWPEAIQDVINYNNTFKNQLTKITQKIAIDFLKDKIPHIFADRPGHLINTPANRQLLLDLASDAKNYFKHPDARGTLWCEKILGSVEFSKIAEF